MCIPDNLVPPLPCCDLTWSALLNMMCVEKPTVARDARPAVLGRALLVMIWAGMQEEAGEGA
jgi:hypothetical protein